MLIFWRWLSINLTKKIVFMNFNDLLLIYNKSYWNIYIIFGKEKFIDFYNYLDSGIV